MWKITRFTNLTLKYMLTQQRNKCISDTFKFSEEVSASLAEGWPVVALESTVITHGLPYPENMRCALKMEEIVRQNKATPATIGVIKGNVHVGMSLNELEHLASENKNTIKISRRDLPYILSQGLSGGTTVAATMVLAYRAGISLFVTGGIGGVHRGAETSMDISADLYELSRTPMTVVSAGVKSILDIGRTLEYLETLGVCVATFGASREFPSFFTPGSKFLAPCNVETSIDAARLIDARNKLELEGGILIAVPIPQQYHEDGYKTEAVIEEALEEARKKNIVGRDVTPFVLNKVRELSGGASLRANLGLLENNAVVGSQIAVKLNELKKLPTRGTQSFVPPVCMDVSSKGKPVVIGGSNLDIHVKCRQRFQADGSTLDGEVDYIGGGVGRNVADCLTRLGLDPFFISAMGSRESAGPLLSKMEHMNTNGITLLPDYRTATCVVLLDYNGECLSVLGDMKVHDSITSKMIKGHIDIISAAPMVIMDGNIPVETMMCLLNICEENNVPVWFEPTDVSRAFRPFEGSKSPIPKAMSYASPNFNELREILKVIRPEGIQEHGFIDRTDEVLRECFATGRSVLLNNLHSLVITLGRNGVVLLTTLPEEVSFPLNLTPCDNEARSVHFEALTPKDIVSVSGAGDCLAGAMIGGILKGLTQHQCIHAGQIAAALSLASQLSVPDTITPDVFNSAKSDRIVFKKLDSF